MGRSGLVCHRIRPNDRSGGYPHLVCFVDTETTHRQFVGGKINDLQFGICEFWEGREERSHHTFHTRAEFTNLLLEFIGPARKQRSVTVFAHNMGFDAQVLGITDQFRGRGWEITSTILESPPFMIRLRDGASSRRTLTLMDSMNFMRRSLAELGTVFGIEKMTDPGVHTPWSQREEYCRNDVRILRTIMFSWFDFCLKHDLGMFAISQAAQSLAAWRHRFMHHEVFVNHDPDVVALEREAYMGGRTEAFWIGRRERVGHVDVNSIYPSVMHSEMFPVRLRYRRRSGGSSALLTDLVARPGTGLIAEVWLDTRGTRDNGFPVKGDRVIFPVGQFRTVLCTPELRIALERGYVTRVGRYHVYDMAPIFREFVGYFYALRRRYADEGNDAWKEITKIFMNSLYGKFGQRTPEWEDVTGPEERDVIMQVIEPNSVLPILGYGTYRRIGDHLEKRCPAREEAYNASCCIAAHVTSYARVILAEGIETAGRDEVYYCDTDSLFCSMLGKERMVSAGIVDPARLGAWKDEGDVAEFDIYGAKDYVKDGKPRRKGVRPSAVEIAPGVFRQEMFVSFAGSLRRGTFGEQQVLTIEKHLSREYRKGTVTASGKVIPLVLDIDVSERYGALVGIHSGGSP